MCVDMTTSLIYGVYGYRACATDVNEGIWNADRHSNRQSLSVGTPRVTRIEWKASSKSHDVELFGSWDKFQGGVFLEYQEGN